MITFELNEPDVTVDIFSDSHGEIRINGEYFAYISAESEIWDEILDNIN